MTRLIVECIIRGNWLPQSNAVQLDQVEAAEGAEENEAQRRRRIGPCRVSLSFSPGLAVCGPATAGRVEQLVFAFRVLPERSPAEYQVFPDDRALDFQQVAVATEMRQRFEEPKPVA